MKSKIQLFKSCDPKVGGYEQANVDAFDALVRLQDACKRAAEIAGNQT